MGRINVSLVALERLDREIALLKQRHCNDLTSSWIRGDPNDGLWLDFQFDHF